MRWGAVRNHAQSVSTDEDTTKKIGKPSEPRWLTIARGELGQHELAGPASNPRIVLYLRSAGMFPNDEAPWCSAFVNWCVEQAGLPGTDRGAARSWLSWGVPLEQPQLGAIAVLWRDAPNSPHGHVAFYVGGDANTITLLGGNQGNAVSIRQYPRARVLAYRWPASA